MEQKIRQKFLVRHDISDVLCRDLFSLSQPDFIECRGEIVYAVYEVLILQKVQL